MSGRVYRIDAFAGPFCAGNPAAVCPLESWMDAEAMQALALENNLSETAFFVRKGDGYDLRWFTPACEVDLCGHATLASAFVVFEYLDPAAELVRFHTRSGELRVRRDGELLTMDFPARPPERSKPSAVVARALGQPPLELWAARDYMAVYESEEDVRSLETLRGRGCRDIFVPRIADYNLRLAPDIERFFADARPEVLFHLAAAVGGIGANRENPGRLFYENAIVGVQSIARARRNQVEKTIVAGAICSSSARRTASSRCPGIPTGRATTSIPPLRT